MSTEVHEPAVRKPTIAESEEMRQLLDRIRTLKPELMSVRARIEFSDKVSVDDRIRLTDLEIELDRLLHRADYFIAKFG